MTLLRNSQIHATIYSLRYIYRFFNLSMRGSLPSTCHARMLYNLSSSSAISTYLLYHKRTLSNGLEALPSASSTNRWRCTWLSSRSLTCSTNISPSKCYSFLWTIHCIHEVNLHVQHNVLSFWLSLTSSPWSSFSKHLLKLFKYISKWCSSRSLSTIELRWETFKSFKASKSLSKWPISTLKWILTSKWILCLLISCHSSLVIYISFSFITQSFISIINLREFFFCFRCFVHIWMVLLCQLKVTFLDLRLWWISTNSQKIIKVISTTTSSSTSTTSCKVSLTTIC